MGSELRHLRRHEMKADTARNGGPPQDGADMRPLRRAAGLILLFNGLLVALVLVKPLSDACLPLWSTRRSSLVRCSRYPCASVDY